MTDVKIKTTAISMFITIHMQSKRKSYILQTLCFFYLKHWLSAEKYYNFTYNSFLMYLMTKCCKSGNTTCNNYKIKDSVITRVDKM